MMELDDDDDPTQAPDRYRWTGRRDAVNRARRGHKTLALRHVVGTQYARPFPMHRHDFSVRPRQRVLKSDLHAAPPTSERLNRSTYHQTVEPRR